MRILENSVSNQYNLSEIWHEKDILQQFGQQHKRIGTQSRYFKDKNQVIVSSHMYKGGSLKDDMTKNPESYNESKIISIIS